MTTTLNIIKPKNKRPKPVKVKHPPLALKMVQFTFGTLGRVFPKLFGKMAFKFFITPRTRAKHKVSDSILEQAKISEILIGKNMLKTYEWGEGEETVLLVHGWESRGTALRSFVPKLLEFGYKVVAFDAPAHGDSSGKTVTLKSFSEAIKALYHKFDNVQHVIAHSFGGAATAYRSIALKSFTIIGTPSRISYPIDAAIKTMNAPKGVANYFRKKLEEVAEMKIEDLTIKNIHKDLKIDRVLIVHDKQDKAVLFEEALENVKHWKNAEFQVTDGFGHFALMKNEEVIERVAGFTDHGRCARRTTNHGRE